MKKHKWIKEEGDIDIFAYEKGQYHNGPKCSVCGFGFCHHCYPEGYDTSCPCDSLDGDDSKLDLNILALNDRLKQRVNRMYVYIESEHNANGSLWTVGFYNPKGEWIPESDWESMEGAAERVHYLNGGK